MNLEHLALTIGDIFVEPYFSTHEKWQQHKETFSMIDEAQALYDFAKANCGTPIFVELVNALIDSICVDELFGRKDPYHHEAWESHVHHLKVAIGYYVISRSPLDNLAYHVGLVTNHPAWKLEK